MIWCFLVCVHTFGWALGHTCKSDDLKRCVSAWCSHFTPQGGIAQSFPQDLFFAFLCNINIPNISQFHTASAVAKGPVAWLCPCFFG